MEKHILVVEDDRDIRESLLELLSQELFHVTGVSNGQEALDWLLNHEQKPHLILLDLMMPVKDGFQFREEQRSNPAMSDIPVVVMSADGRVMEKKAKLAASAYLRKPVELEEILHTVRAYCA